MKMKDLFRDISNMTLIEAYGTDTFGDDAKNKLDPLRHQVEKFLHEYGPHTSREISAALAGTTKYAHDITAMTRKLREYGTIESTEFVRAGHLSIGRTHFITDRASPPKGVRTFVPYIIRKNSAIRKKIHISKINRNTPRSELGHWSGVSYELGPIWNTICRISSRANNALRDDLRSALVLFMLEGGDENELVQVARHFVTEQYRHSSFSKFTISLDAPVFEEGDSIMMDRLVEENGRVVLR